MKLKQRIVQWWSDFQPFLTRIKEIMADRRGEGTMEGVMEVFNVFSQVLIGGKIYLVERHFNGERDFRQAVFSAVENEAKREETVSKPA